MYLTDEEKDTLANENMKLIHYICHKYHNKFYEYEEIFSIALQGFAKSLKGFDPGRGVRFQTYASQAMINVIFRYYRDAKRKLKQRVVSNRRDGL